MNRGSIQTGIWLIGLGILFLTGRFWPEILIVIGLSMLATALIPKSGRRIKASYAPEGSSSAYSSQPVEADDLDDEHLPPALGAEYAPPTTKHDTSELPSECPMCGGSVLANENDLEWVGRSSARCPYCGTRLPLLKTKESLKQPETQGEVSDEQ